MPPAERARGTLPVLFSIVILDLVGFGVVIPVLPFYADYFGANATVLGLLLTAYAAMQFVFAPIWGRLSDRVGRRRVMLVTIAGTSAGLLLLGLADALVWLFVARIVGGMFGANVSVASAYITDVTSEEERTRFMGMIGASFGVGFLLGPALGALLAPYGYSVPMLFAAGLAAINFVYALFVLREPEMRHRVEAPPARIEVLAEPSTRRIVLANLAFSLSVTQLETVFPYLMKDRFDYDVPQVAWILVLMAAVMGAIQGGGMKALAARFGERSLVLGGALLMAASFFVIPWVHVVAILLVPLVVSAIGRAVSQPSLMSLVSSTAAEHARGAVMGTFQSAGSLARVLGPIAAGALYDLTQGGPFWLAAVLMSATIAIALGFRERLSAKAP